MRGRLFSRPRVFNEEGNELIARIAYFEGVDFSGRDYVLDAARRVPGFHAAYHLADPETGEAVSVSIWQDADALERGTAAIRRARTEGGHGGPTTPARVRTYEVVRSA